MPPLELAFGGSAWLWRLVLEETQALMGATRLASGKYAAIINSSSARILTPNSIPKQDASPPLEVAFSAFGLLLTSSAAAQQFKQA